MRAHRTSAALLLSLAVALSSSSCAQSSSPLPETSEPPVPEPPDAGEGAAAAARRELDARLREALPRWSVYTRRPPASRALVAGCREHTFLHGWVYFRSTVSWDEHCQLVAVPEGALGDPSRWVRFSMTEMVARGPYPYFLGLLEGGLPLADLLGITLAVVESPDDLPALPEPSDRAPGLREQGGYRRGSVKAPGHSSGQPGPSRGPRGLLPPPALWPRNDTPPRGQWEPALAGFFNHLQDALASSPTVLGPLDRLRRASPSPALTALCSASGPGDEVPVPLARFPEVVGLAVACALSAP